MMKLSLNLITLALVSVSGTAMANYGLANANTDKVNFEQWECSRCENSDGAQGHVGVSLGVVDGNDQHVGNHFYGQDDGAVGGIDAVLGYRRAGHQAQVMADKLGSEHGVLSVTAGKAGVAMVSLDHSRFTEQHASATTPYAVNGASLVDTGADRQQALSTEREHYGLGVDANLGNWQTYAHYQQQEKSSVRSAPLRSEPRLILPTDSTTKNYQAGATLNGEGWFFGARYLYSQHKNNQGTALAIAGVPDYLAYEPSNDALQVMLHSGYQWDRSAISGRLVGGQMKQDAGLVNSADLSRFDGKVETWDLNLDYSNVLSNKLRLRAGLDHSIRDNKSTVYDGQGLKIDPLTGDLQAVTLIDTQTTRANLGASYRIASGYRVLADYQFEQKQSQAAGWDDEQTRDHALDLKLRVTEFDLWDLSLKAGYSQRDQSKMDADRLLSGDNNTLLRRYNLADRDRTELELMASHSPLAQLSLDFRVHYALDDYSDVGFGLSEGEDRGYELGVGYQLGKAHLHGYFGQQWIDAVQFGTVGLRPQEWRYDIEDQFSYVGAGVSYPLLSSLELGLDYQYSDSTSDTRVDNALVTPYGDYFAHNHSVELYGEYDWSARTQLRLSYHYERFEETDFANNALFGADYLGDLSHNYAAHLLMLGLRYQL